MPQMQFIAALYGLYAGEGDLEGQGLVEYVMILGFIAIVIIVAMIFFQDKLSGLFSKIGNSVPN